MHQINQNGNYFKWNLILRMINARFYFTHINYRESNISDIVKSKMKKDLIICVLLATNMEKCLLKSFHARKLWCKK